MFFLLMRTIVSYLQNVFVKGRQILDVAMIAKDVIHSRLKNGLNHVICKLDLEKGYDYVNWAFLLEILDKMGFGKKKWCISTVRFLVLVK